MTAQIVDINQVRLSQFVGREICKTTRTEIKRTSCPFCEGHGLLQRCSTGWKPIGFEDALKAQAAVFICQRCAGTGYTYHEVEIEEAV